MASLRSQIPLSHGASLDLVFGDEADSQIFGRDFHFHVQQVHGADIYEMREADLARLATHDLSPLASADGIFVGPQLLARLPAPIVVKSADCLPLLFVDRAQPAIAAVHAGWRGILQGIHRAPFERGLLRGPLTEVWVGPSLNGSNFETGPDMWSQFPAAVLANPRYFADVSVTSGAGSDAVMSIAGPNAASAIAAGKKTFWPWHLVEDELEALGACVNVCGVNTLDDPEFASYRRAKTQLNGARNLSWIRLRP